MLLKKSLYLDLSLSLSFSLSFLPLPSCSGVPGCFRHSWEPFSSSLGVSLDACVVAGNTFFSFPFFFFFFLFSPIPLPPSCAMRSHTKEALHRLSSPPLVSLFTLPLTHICSPVFFHVLLSSCLGISFLLSFARTSVPALVCQVPQV